MLDVNARNGRPVGGEVGGVEVLERLAGELSNLVFGAEDGVAESTAVGGAVQQLDGAHLVGDVGQVDLHARQAVGDFPRLEGLPDDGVLEERQGRLQVVAGNFDGVGDDLAVGCDGQAAANLLDASGDAEAGRLLGGQSGGDAQDM